MNRRRFLQFSATATATATAGATLTGCSAPGDRRRSEGRLARLGPGSPRRIIHVVSDGMSQGTLTCADHLSHLVRGRGLTWLELWKQRDACTAMVDMRSLDSLVTDSSAASSSWGSGCRVRNGTLNVTSKDEPLTPLMALFGQAGWRRGLVTTTEITHATPAGFTVSVKSRGDGEEIALRYLDAKLDVYLGGAKNHFDPAKRKDKRDLWADFAGAGYQVLQNRTDLEQASTDRPWLGTFSSGHLPFTLDRDRDPKLQKAVPTLASMTARALEHLGRGDRFLLQVEGGRVDHGCHNNDAAAALWDQIALDEAIDVILDFRARHPETLVVLTTDHGNSNLGLNGTGSNYRDSQEAFARLTRMQASFPILLKELKDAVAESDEAAAKVLAERTGYAVPPEKLTRFLPAVNGKRSALYDQMKSDTSSLGQLMANHLGIGFTGPSHTSDFVTLIAVGPGAHRLRGHFPNTDIFRHYTDLARIDYRNPEEPLLAQCPGTDPAVVEDTASYALA